MGLVKKSSDPMCVAIRKYLDEHLPTVNSLTACMTVRRQFKTTYTHQFGDIRVVVAWPKKHIQIIKYYPKSSEHPEDVAKDFVAMVELILVKKGCTEEVEDLWGDISAMFPVSDGFTII